MDRMKYIIYSDGINWDIPIIFSPGIEHSDMAQIVNAKEIESAGFVSFDDSGDLVCWGESVSLKVKANTKVDSKRINGMLGK